MQLHEGGNILEFSRNVWIKDSFQSVSSLVIKKSDKTLYSLLSDKLKHKFSSRSQWQICVQHDQSISKRPSPDKTTPPSAGQLGHAHTQSFHSIS